MADLEKMMDSCKEVFLREVQGLNVNSNMKAAFEEKYLRELEDAKNLVDIDFHVRYIIISVDPNGGGRNSDYAVVSACYDGSGTMIVSACWINSFRSISLFMNALQRS